MAVGDVVGNVLRSRLNSSDDSRVFVQTVQCGHTHAVAVPQILTGKDTVTVIHVLGIDGAVGNSCAFHTPFIAEDAGHQAAVGTAPDDAEAVEGAHDVAASFFYSTFKALKIEFTDCLLVGPGGYAVTAFFLIVESKVLAEDINTLSTDSGYFNLSNLAGYPAVFRVILEVTAGIRRTVNIGSGAVEAGIDLVRTFFGSMEEVFANAGTHILNQLTVVGGSHNVLRSVSHGGCAAHQRGGEALGAILIKRAGEVDGRGSLREVEAVVNQGSRFTVRQLADEFRPARIIIACFCQIASLQRACYTDSRHCCIGIVFRLHLFHNGNMAFFSINQAVRPHLFGNLQRLRGWPGTLPVIAAEVSNSLAAVTGILIQVGIVKEVGNRIACLGRNGISVILGRIGPLGGKSCIAGSAHAGSVRAFGHQDVVHGIMAVAADGEVIITLLKNVGLLVIRIVGSEIFLIDDDIEVLRLAGFDHLLVETADFHSGLLNEILAVIIGVRALEVDLHSVLAVNRADVLYVNRSGKCTVTVFFDGEVGILKIGIAQAVAEGESDVCIIVIIACIPLIEHIVFIAGFKVAVTDVDAFLINNIVGIALGNAGVGIVLCRCGCIVSTVSPLISAEVLHGRSSVIVLHKGVNNAAGGVNIAGENIRDAEGACHTDITYPKHCVNAVFVNEIKLQGVGAVEQDNNLFESAVSFQLFEIFKHLDLFLAKAEIVAVRHKLFQLFQTGRNIRTFSSGTGQDNQRYIAVICPGFLESIRVLFPGNFVDAVLALVTACCGSVDAFITGSGIEFPLVGIDCAFTEDRFQSGLQGSSIINGHRAGACAAIEQIEGRLGESCELGAFSQRQGVIAVDQQRGTFRFDLAAELFFMGNKIFFVVPGTPEINFGIGIRNNLLGGCLQEVVDNRAEAVRSCQGDGNGENGKQYCHNGSQNTPDLSRLLDLCFLFFLFAHDCSFLLKKRGRIGMLFALLRV